MFHRNDISITNMNIDAYKIVSDQLKSEGNFLINSMEGTLTLIHGRFIHVYVSRG